MSHLVCAGAGETGGKARHQSTAPVNKRGNIFISYPPSRMKNIRTIVMLDTNSARDHFNVTSSAVDGETFGSLLKRYAPFKNRCIIFST